MKFENHDKKGKQKRELKIQNQEKRRRAKQSRKGETIRSNHQWDSENGGHNSVKEEYLEKGQ